MSGDPSDRLRARLRHSRRVTAAAVALLALAGVGLVAALTGQFGFALGALLPTALAAGSLQRDDTRLLVAAVGTLLVVAGLFWAPLFQGLVYAVGVVYVASLYWLVVGLLLAAVGATLWLRMPERVGGAALGLVALGVLVAMLGTVLVGPTMSNVYANEQMADEVLGTAEQLESLPESDEARPRIAPLTVSKTRAQNTLQYPRYRLGTCDVTFLDQTPHWSCPLVPDGTVNSWTQRQIGAVYVNQSSFEKDIRIDDDSSFQTGLGMLLTDSVHWQLRRHDYWNRYGEPFVVPHGDESFIAVPYTDHRVEYKLFPVPQPYTVPEFGGVKLVAENGSVTDLSPTAARNHPALNGTNGEQNIYPYSLARFQVKSISYQHGVVNTLISHRDQIELADVPGQGNDQPFVVPTEEGVRYFLAVEPWGDASGVYQIWDLDAQTGEMRYLQLDRDSSLRGPRKAVDAVMADPALARLNDVDAVEPIPVVSDGTLYWTIRVVPESASSITYIAFFNAETDQVTLARSTRAVNAFIAGNRRMPDNGTAGPDGEEPDDGLTIVIQRPDGSTETITVPEGSNVTIAVPERNGTAG
ncbi:hypothetical protein ACKVMT_17660 [Halobacteriales archaeon Cl-PHB]